MTVSVLHDARLYGVMVGPRMLWTWSTGRRRGGEGGREGTNVPATRSLPRAPMTKKTAPTANTDAARREK